MSGKIGPNQPCTCGSGVKFKKCCGPRGGLTEIEYAEEQAYKYERDRERILRPRRGKSAMIPFLFAGMMGMDLSGPGPAPPTPRKRGRRKP